MLKQCKLLLTALVLITGAHTTAEAAFNLRHLAVPRLPQTASRMEQGEHTGAPIAYIRFCLNYDSQCHSGSEAKRIELNSDNWTEIAQVNAEINDRIRPDSHKGGYNWSLDTTYGNCNDYAVQKRHALLEKGYPMSALALSVVITPWGEGHLVLSVRTDRGDFVLDNLRPVILPWNRTGYEWVKVQSASNPGDWERPSEDRFEPRVFKADYRTQTQDQSPVQAQLQAQVQTEGPGIIRWR